MKKITYIISVLLAGFITANAQKVQIKKADKLYEGYEYIDAITTYEKVINKGYKNPEMLQSLANAYYFNAQYAKAAKWYGELFALEPEVSQPEYYLRYSISLKSLEEYEKADEYLEKYYQARGEARPEIKDYLQTIKENSGRYEIRNAQTINSEKSDYGATIYKGKLIFTSTRQGGFFSRNNKWNNQPHSVLYAAAIDIEGNPINAVPFSDKLNSKFDEATPVFTNDGNTVYFTRTNYLKKRGYSQDRTTFLKIYRATLKDGNWTDIIELPFNSDDFNTAHPALSPDNSTLYFASDRPGGFGDADIWKVTIHSDGTFGEPINLGPTVNTEGRESFPFVSSENELYFASNGKLGLGGLDIFMSKITEQGSYEEAVNLGEPINSPVDDFGFYISKFRHGFFTSNREGGMGDDDIYTLVEIKKPICEQLITGLIRDFNTRELLADAKVSLYDENRNIIAQTTTDKTGRYYFKKDKVLCDTRYRVRAEKEHYSVEEDFVKTPNQSGESVVNLFLRKTKEELAVGKTLNEILDIPVIYFDLDKWNIRPDAEVQIAKVLQVMEDYPQMKIEIGSHTDSRATHAYNEKLSERRANSTRDWLIKHGIAPDRLTAKGYGETQLVNECADGVECTEEQHQLNRRSIFMITSMGE